MTGLGRVLSSWRETEMLPRRYSEADETMLRALILGGGRSRPVHPGTVVD